jgi:IS5 family transposase
MAGKQLGFGNDEQSSAKKQPKREKFLAEMAKVVPCHPFIDLIEPSYHKTVPKAAALPSHWRPCSGNT